MTGKQHQIVGIGFGVASAIIMTGAGIDYGFTSAITSAIGCWLPDMDHNSSKLGRKRKALTTATKKTINVVSIAIIILAIVGLAARYFTDYIVPFSNSQLIIAIALVLALRKLFFILGNNKGIQWMAKHRGLMHTLIVPAIMYVFTGSLDGLLYSLMMGLTVGYCSHLFADTFTVAGCPLLFPLTTMCIHFTNWESTKDKKKIDKCSKVLAVLAVVAAIVYTILF